MEQRYREALKTGEGRARREVGGKRGEIGWGAGGTWWGK